MASLPIALFKRIRPKTLLLVYVLFIAVLTAALLLHSGSVTGGPAQPNRSGLGSPNLPPAVEVGRGALKTYLILDGELRAVRSRTIFADISDQAKITYLAPEGSIVKPGDRLVELDSTTIVDKIKDIEERIVAAESEIVQVQSTQESELREMEIELSKMWLAHEQARVKAKLPELIVPRREYQENLLAVEKTKTEYANQQAKIKEKKKEQSAELQVKIIEKDKLNAQLEQARKNIDNMTVKAPAEAMVIYTEHWEERRKMQVGDVVWEGYPLVMLPDLREMEVLAQVNEVDGPKLAPGQKTKIRLDSYPEVEIAGSIKEISQTAVKASSAAKARIFYVVVSMEKTASEIMKPGMSAQISVLLAEAPPQLLIPRPSVRFAADSAQVLKLDDKDARRPVAVKVLSSDPHHYAVDEQADLRQGDRILSSWPR